MRNLKKKTNYDLGQNEAMCVETELGFESKGEGNGSMDHNENSDPKNSNGPSSGIHAKHYEYSELELSQAWDPDLKDIVVDLPFFGGGGYPFKWERGKGTDKWVEVLLDRALVTPSWLDKFQGAQLLYLEVSTSDHCPILLAPVVQLEHPSCQSFKFENAWLREPMCRKLIEDVWLLNHESSLDAKIKQCSKVLADWGKDITGNFQSWISQCKKRIRLLKGRCDVNSAQKYQEENEKLFEMLTQKKIF
uniref:Uncharacterized protein n=1 Tax=Cannabis sativa TaxID=3483 RepID=A0A803PUY4_CANSA